MHSSVFVSHPTLVQVVVRNESGIGGALILIGPNYSAPLPPLKFGSIVPSLWRNLFRRKLQGFRNLARGAYFSRIDVERRITSKSIMGRGIERCASSLLGVVIHSTFQRPCSIGNCGKDERHTTAMLSRRRASCNQSYFQRSTFPNPSSRREGTRMYIFKSPDKCIE